MAIGRTQPDTYYTRLPLRLVVEVYQGEHGSMMERYECGHSWYARMNPYSGVRRATRRRCSFCGPQSEN
jgi:hypothetical protein